MTWSTPRLPTLTIALVPVVLLPPPTAPVVSCRVLSCRVVLLQIHVFVSNSIANRVIGLQIANEIISEMNVKTKHRSLTYHRKIAVSFRDHSLFR